jgi:hypothetical protein
VFNSQGVRYFIREEALAYITNVEMIDLPLVHLQEELEDEFGYSQPENLLVMFYKRIRTQLIQLKELITIDFVQKLNSYLNNSPLKSSSVSSIDDITRDNFNLNKLIIAATSVGKVFGIYTGSDGRILWSLFLPDSIPFRFNKPKNVDTMPLFVQRTAAHVPYEPQCALITKVKSTNSQDSKSRIYFFNPLTGKPSKDFPKNGLVLNYQIKQAFLANSMDSHFAKHLILFDSENKLHVLPEKSTEDLKFKSNKPSIIYATSEESDRENLLVGYLVQFGSEVITLIPKKLILVLSEFNFNVSKTLNRRNSIFGNLILPFFKFLEKY